MCAGPTYAESTIHSVAVAEVTSSFNHVVISGQIRGTAPAGVERSRNGGGMKCEEAKQSCQLREEGRSESREHPALAPASVELFPQQVRDIYMYSFTDVLHRSPSYRRNKDPRSIDLMFPWWTEKATQC